MHGPVSVLVVDDSALMRNLISKMIEATPGLRVADRAMNGLFALQKIPRINPDVIVLDIEMPEMNGIEFLRERKKAGIDIPVVILSSIAKRGAAVTMEALALGASDFIMKPSGSISEDIHTVRDNLTGMLLAYGTQYRIKRGLAPKSTVVELPPATTARPPEQISPSRPVSPVVAPPRPGIEPKKTPEERPQQSRKPGNTEIIAIGISTGGPNALREVFAKLDASLQIPIVVVQHMPAGFTYEFAKSLDRISSLEIKEAEEGDIVKPGRVLIAPGNYHLTIEKKPLATIARLNQNENRNGHRPSVDVLFESVAREYGQRAMGIIMTGMGRDGAQELGSMYKAGAITLSQSPESCVVYGMPKVAWEMGHAMEQVALADMATRIKELAKEVRE